MGVIRSPPSPVKLDAISNESGNLCGVPGEMVVRLRWEERTMMFVSVLHAVMGAVWVASAFTGWSWW